MRFCETTSVTWRHAIWLTAVLAWSMMSVYAYELTGWRWLLANICNTAVFISASLDLLVMNRRRLPSVRDSVYLLPLVMVLGLLMSLSGVLTHLLWPVFSAGCLAYLLWSVVRSPG